MNRALLSAAPVSDGAPLRRTLGTASLVFVMFFNVSGGAFTLEELVASVGPGLALLVLAAVPLLWSLPEVLLIGELASMLPEEGGYYQWVKRAFGPFWAFQCGWCTWVYSLVDMAIYPVLFHTYLAHFVPDLSTASRVAVTLAVIWLPTLLNLRGAGDVGRGSVVAGAFVLISFAVMAVAAIPNASNVPWQPFTRPDTNPLDDLGVGISIAIWNYIGWDNASTVQGEVRDAGRTYPRALAIALPLVVIAYFVPLLTALAATDWTTFAEGAWPVIARQAAGGEGVLAEGLELALGIAALVSAVALFDALLLAYSRIPFAMACDGLLPRALAKTDARGTPRNAVLVAAVIYSVFALLPFETLVVADVLLYAIALFLEFGALLALRRREPALRGPFRVPLGLGGLCVLTAMPMVFFAFATTLTLRDPDYGAPAIAGAVFAALAGPLAYRAAVRRRGDPSESAAAT